ncbi:hypothetical protein MC885_019768, partial [Smutsia gigantea]
KLKKKTPAPAQSPISVWVTCSHRRGRCSRFPVRRGPQPGTFGSACWPLTPEAEGASEGLSTPRYCLPPCALLGPPTDHARGRVLGHLPENVLCQPPGHVRRGPSGA